MLLFAVIFIALFGLILLCVGLGFAFQRSQQNKQIYAMLRTADPAAGEQQVKLLSANAKDAEFVASLKSLAFVKRLDLILEQAGSASTGIKLIVTSCIVGIVVAFVGSQLPIRTFRPMVILSLAILGGSIPFLLVFRKRSKRLARFEEQFPEALDFISRSMRAGHGFGVAMEMLVLDSPEPLSGAFRRVLTEVHLGSPLDVALAKLILQIPILDVRFFNASVLLQQETGGNLSEILSKLSHVIRERFRLKGQVKAAAAHGKITGLILLIMPIVVAILMFFISPGYLGILFSDPTGKRLLMFAIVAQFIGYLCIKKIVNIKV